MAGGLSRLHCLALPPLGLGQLGPPLRPLLAALVLLGLPAAPSGMALASLRGGREEDLSFFLRDCPVDEHPELYRTQGHFLRSALSSHPSRMKNETRARFSFSCLVMPPLSLHGEVVSKRPGSYDGLPQRSPGRPYILFGWDRQDSTDAAAISAARSDVLVSGFDLRPWGEDSGTLPNGITVASPHFYEGPAVDLAQPSKYFLTFRGRDHGSMSRDKTFHVRQVLGKSLARSRLSRSDVKIEIFGNSVPPFTKKCSGCSGDYWDLMDSSYVLVLAGHGRWSYRLSEAIGACAIPVLMADGITLPFEDLLDWSSMSVRIPESVAAAKGNSTASEEIQKRVLSETDEDEQGEALEGQRIEALARDPQELLNLLPSDPETILAMRKRVCAANRKYFATEEKRATGMLEAAVAHVSKAGLLA